MALSDYLTDDEWDACFYYFMYPTKGFTDLGQAMRQVIENLLTEGYQFEGLDETGNKKRQLPSGNPSKIMMFFDGAKPDQIIKLMSNGREFLKKNAPKLLLETDEEWTELTTNPSG